jgi:hypothetical protein
MVSKEGSDRRGDSRVRFLSEISALIASVAAIFATYVDLRSPLVVTSLSTVVGASLLLIVAARRLYRVRTISITIALGGHKGVGKTAYVNVLMDQLMRGEGSEISFVPEAQTAQHVYQVMGRLRRGTWPPSTGSDNVSRYRGKIALARLSLSRLLLNGRVEFSLEIGDSAGENWEAVAEEYKESSPPRLIESTFFRYIGEESDVLFYFIDSNTLISEPWLVLEQVDDLLSTVQLLRTIQGGDPGRPLQRAVALIFSKADLLTSEQREAIRELLELGSLKFSVDKHVDSQRYDAALSRGFSGSLYELERLVAILEKQLRSYKGFLVSAASATDLRRGELIENPLSDSGVDRPLAWTLEQLWAAGRSFRQ